MDKKIIIGLVVLGLLGAALFYVKFPGYFIKPENFSNQISGQITEVKNGSIVVDGIVKSSDPEGKRQEKKIIEFKITPETLLKKTALVIGEQKLRPDGSSEPFTPEKKEMQGRSSDLTPNTTITLLKSKENLFNTNNATALEINYFGFEYQD